MFMMWSVMLFIAVLFFEGRVSVGLLRSEVLGSKRVNTSGILGISDFLGRRVSIGFIYRLNGRFCELFGSRGVAGVLAVRTSKVNVTYLTTRCFNIPIIFTGGAGAVGVCSSACGTAIRSCARGESCSVIISGRFLDGRSGILVVSSFLTGNDTLATLLVLVRGTNTGATNTKVIVRGTCRNNNGLIHSVNVEIRSLTGVGSVDGGSKVIFYGR